MRLCISLELHTQTLARGSGLRKLLLLPRIGANKNSSSSKTVAKDMKIQNYNFKDLPTSHTTAFHI
jgi:hypothetical protein